MFERESVPSERAAELLKLAAVDEVVSGLKTQPTYARSLAIQQQARLVLGLEISTDIAEMDEITANELLLVMRTMRDAVFPNRPDDTMGAT